MVNISEVEEESVPANVTSEVSPGSASPPSVAEATSEYLRASPVAAVSETPQAGVADQPNSPESSEDAKQSEPSGGTGGSNDPEMLAAAERLKAEGNACFTKREYAQAEEFYSQAIEYAPESASERAVYFANRAACCLATERYEDVIKDCSVALEVNPSYVKALTRRAQAYEHLDDPEKALEDVKRVLELDASHRSAGIDAKRLEPVVNEKREKMKEEMIGKLKDLGNSVLGNFGLSLDNFKATQDPNTGSYNISFQQ